MKKIWIAVVVVATFGSIYPFDFQALGLDAATLGEFLRSCCTMPSRGDVLGNVILFVPVGFIGVLATRPENSIRRRFLSVCIVGALVALALQLMQIFLPSRDANLQDVVWNVVGTAGGAFLARFVKAFSSSTEDEKADASLVPLTLVGTWLIYRLIPFVPSLDFQLVKDSLKPVLNYQLKTAVVLLDVTAWLVVAYLLRHAKRGRRLDNYLPALMIAVFCLEVFIVDNSISSSNLAGAILAVVFWWGVLPYIRRQEFALLILLLCTLAITGLAPFDIRFEPAPFNWLPFYGFLNGSMDFNSQSAAKKVFVYGSLLFLLRRSDVGVFVSMLIGTSFVAIIEFAQTRFSGHTPEITDPLLIIVAAAALLVLEKQDKRSALIGRIGTSPQVGSSEATGESQFRAKRRHSVWKTLSVNLRGYQFDFLVLLSREMEVSISNATRHVIAQHIKGRRQFAAFASKLRPGNSALIGPPSNTTDLEPDNSRERWVGQYVNLHGSQYDYLVRLSQEKEISISKAARQIVTQLIDGPEEDD